MAKFNPIYLSDEDVEDIATFLNFDRNYCRRRILEYDSQELGKEWARANPKTAEQIIQFYSTTDLYVWELTQWHASKERDVHRDIVRRVVNEFPPSTHPRVLDYGSGIGSETILFSRMGYSVVYADVPGITSRFAAHRLRRRGLLATFLPVRSCSPKLPGTFDIIICFDVLEHHPNPSKLLHLFRRHLSPKGVMAVTVCFWDPGEQGYHLHSNFRLFGGMRFFAQMEGVGFVHLGGGLFKKSKGFKRLLCGLRYCLWSATGVWLEVQKCPFPMLRPVRF